MAGLAPWIRNCGPEHVSGALAADFLLTAQAYFCEPAPAPRPPAHRSNPA